MEIQKATTTIPDLSILLAVYERWEREQLEQQSLKKMKMKGLGRYYFGGNCDKEEV